MDLFMDKLAQKFNAQEMINANKAADAEEKKRMLAQIKAYEDCLEQMCQLSKELKKNKEEMIGDLQVKISQLDQNNLDDKQEQEQIMQELEKTGVELEKTRQDVTALRKSVNDVSASVNDNLHKECVKVYRNVQAVIQEKAENQNAVLETLVQNTESAKSMILEHKTPRGTLKAILTLSVVSLLISLGSVAFQVLVYLNLI